MRRVFEAMRKVCVIGHFGFGMNMINGQTIKTKTITNELEKQLGEDQVEQIDTHGGAKALPKIILGLLRGFKNCSNIIILPAHNGIRIFVPICSIVNKIFHRRLHYVVIGGWLNELLDEHRQIEKQLKRFAGIYVETYAMKRALDCRGFENINVMPNFKDLQILKESELVYSQEEPFKLCTFSRVMKEKGIGEAVEAVRLINDKAGRTIFTLDIYGQVDGEQVEWFENLKERFNENIQYCGAVPFEKSVEILKDYYALLFITYYDGEGFAGTLLDAMSAGVPVIASDWKYNNEVVIPGKTGLLINVHNQNELIEKLVEISQNGWNELKVTCIKEANKYTKDKAIQVLLKSLD